MPTRHELDRALEIGEASAILALEPAVEDVDVRELIPEQPEATLADSHKEMAALFLEGVWYYIYSFGYQDVAMGNGLTLVDRVDDKEFWLARALQETRKTGKTLSDQFNDSEGSQVLLQFPVHPFFESAAYSPSGVITREYSTQLGGFCSFIARKTGFLQSGESITRPNMRFRRDENGSSDGEEKWLIINHPSKPYDLLIKGNVHISTKVNDEKIVEDPITVPNAISIFVRR